MLLKKLDLIKKILNYFNKMLKEKKNIFSLLKNFKNKTAIYIKVARLC